jgi:DNA-directed RNA polymerase subunit L
MVEVKVLKSSKDEMEVELDNVTIAEILRVYLNKDPAVAVAVWKRTHPTKNPIMLVRVKEKSAKKVISDAVAHISKDLDKVLDDFKKNK